MTNGFPVSDLKGTAMNLAAAIVVFLFCPPSFAEKWRYVTQGQDGSKFYVDDESIKRLPSARVQYWAEIIYGPQLIRSIVNDRLSFAETKQQAEDIQKKFSRLSKGKSKYEIDCDKSLLMTKVDVNYDNEGKIIEYTEWPDNPETQIVEESVASRIFDEMCNKSSRWLYNWYPEGLSPK